MSANVAKELGPAGPLLDRIGVAALSQHAVQAEFTDTVGTRALHAVEEWCSEIDSKGSYRLRTEKFPFGDVIEHFRCVGRGDAHPALIAKLRDLHASVQSDTPPADEEVSTPPLSSWLRLTFDQEDGDYHTYVGTHLYDGMRERSEGEKGDILSDTIMAALAVDLLSTETSALVAEPSRRQRTRARAAYQLLRSMNALAPAWGEKFEGKAGPFATADVLNGDEALTAAASKAISVAADQIEQPVRLLVETTMLPVTRLHDEQMFIRIIQIFEGLYVHIGRCLERAITALDNGDTEGCRDELSDAANRLEATPALFRVLTTMPREAFAVIRENTNGRSAVQSTSYRRVELLSAPRDPGSFSPQAPFLVLEGETLQEVFERQLPELPSQNVTRLGESMRRLDAGWHMSKRTHWGITLKIIGSAPGTGGTSGADYLQRTAEVSLFPDLSMSENTPTS
ncbi:hypothetical protein ACIQZB_42345 [Streptomyces sp. NPDC097727]|uniref:hypothetical protein n=1 Tax=Streptomyces sp. NPDC097727 TaxID=3366092 RepID=UPI0037FCD711